MPRGAALDSDLRFDFDWKGKTFFPLNWLHYGWVAVYGFRSRLLYTNVEGHLMQICVPFVRKTSVSHIIV